MILYGHYYSPFARRVGAALLHRGIAFDHVSISTRSDTEQVRAINPLVRIPVLRTLDGIHLIESGMILDYVDSLDGRNHLTPPPGPARWHMSYRLALILGTVEKLAVCLYEITRRPAEKIHQPWLEHCLAQACAGLDALESQSEMASKPALRNHADIMLAVMWDFLINHFDVAASDWPQTRRAAEALLALPSLRETRPAWPATASTPLRLRKFQEKYATAPHPELHQSNKVGRFRDPNRRRGYDLAAGDVQ